MLEELAEMKKKTKIIGVSMLTNLDNHDLKRMGFSCGHKKFVENLVKIGVKAGVDGIVSSPKEIKYLKKQIQKSDFCYTGNQIT